MHLCTNTCAIIVLNVATVIGSALGQTAVTDNATRPAFTYRDVDKAWQVVHETQRPLLLFVSMNHCAFCERMESDTFAHPVIADGINELFVTAKLKKEENPPLIQHLGVRAYPTTLVIAPSGDLIVRVEGYAEPKKFVTSIRPALAAYNRARRQMAAVPNSAAKKKTVQQ